MKIHKLPASVRSHIQSGITIADAVQCVLELVYNSLDANATKIAVRIHLKKYLIQVVDNGNGITKEDLNLIGERYMTSKCHDVKELENFMCTYGYRGQALASLIDVSKKLKIETKCKKEKCTFMKVFSNGRPSPVEVQDKDRAGTGVTVTVEDFMHTMPVRRNRIDEIFDIQGIKIQLEHLAVIHHDVCFSIYDEEKGTVILQTHKKPDAILSFADLYGILTPAYLLPLKLNCGNTQIRGFVGKEKHSQGNLQLLFVNKRLVYKSEIQKLVNKVMSKYLDGDLQKKSTNDELSGDKEHHVFVVQINCPYTSYEFLPNLRKSTVEFKNFDNVLKAVYKAVKDVLKPDDKEESKVEVVEKKKIYPVKIFKKREGDVNPEFGTSQLKTKIRGVPVKRKHQGQLKYSTPLQSEVEPKKKCIDLPEEKSSDETMVGQPESPIPDFSQKKIIEKPRKETDVVFKKPKVIPKKNCRSEENLLREFQSWLKIKAKNDSKALSFYKEFINFKQECKADFSDSSFSESVDSPFEEVKKIQFVNELDQKKFSEEEMTSRKVEESPKKLQETDAQKSPFRISFKDNLPTSSQNVDFLSRKNEEMMDIPQLGFNFEFKAHLKPQDEIIKKSKYFMSPAISDSGWNNWLKSKNSKPAQNNLLENSGFSNNSPYFDSFIKFNNIQPDLSSSEEALFQDKEIQTTFSDHEKFTCEEGVKIMAGRRDVMVQTDFNNLESEDEGFYSENLTKKLEYTETHSELEKTSMFNREDFLKTNSLTENNQESKCVSSTSPKNDQPCNSEFFFAERYGFVPKGFSPNFLGSHPNKIPNLNSQEKNQIRSAIPIDDNFLDNVKWLDQDLGINSKALIPFKLLDDMRQEADEKMIYYEDEVLSAAVSKSAIKVHNLLNSFSFAKEYLLNIKVIGQLDKKFIVTLMSITKNKKFHLLVLFDQHAVDERIQLEQLMKDYRTQEGAFKSTALETPIVCRLNESTTRIISHFQKKLEECGIKITCVNPESVTVSEVPTCLFDKDERNSKNKIDKSLDYLIQNLLMDIGEELPQTRGIISTVPKIIRNIISSQACRSAIKFNQSLTMSQMEKMMKDLAECDFPFQCAHGRPSIAPILDIEDFKKPG